MSASESVTPGEGPGTADPTGQTGSGSSGPTGPGDSAGSATGTDSGAEDTTRFDVPGGGVGDDGVTPTGWCKIDFLFVIDNSCSMGNDQDTINASLSGFMETIETKFADHDHHIMVVDTDTLNIDHVSTCRDACAFGLATACNGVPCSALPPNDTCNYQLGMGLNNDKYGFSCNFFGGNRYIIDGQPNLVDTFRCAAADRAGKGYDDEQPAGAMLRAISPEMNAVGGCNAGFLRRDAILVVTIITDEDDDPGDHMLRRTIDQDINSLGEPVAWRQAIIDAKHGDDEAVVMLGLLGDPDVAPAGTWCPPLTDEQGELFGIEGAEETHRLRAFSESFTHGMWAGICEPNYAPFFEQAVGVIDTACEAFVPPPE